MVDVSASQDVGRSDRSKLDTAKEICGVLTLSAIKEASHVGLLCFRTKRKVHQTCQHAQTWLQNDFGAIQTQT
jgi:hypothetical protein